ncbi:NAD-dependent epimerase [Niallia circulans]|uniref:NAD-dependent epimerase n=1 Tax=Niallia circulans TaxID=1397 RepID=UPI00352319B3
MKILVTGAAGFIGMHLSELLLKKGFEVIGYDNLNDYYDVQLKLDRLKVLEKYRNFKFYKSDIGNKAAVDSCFEQENIEVVVNLAAQAGVRYSLENPHAYIESNLLGFINILEACKNHKIKHLIYASSSSVYGANKKMPFSTKDSVDHPVSLYAATKKSNELMAHTYSHLYNLPTTGLRFFTVYGPYGRPDMAYFSFTKNIVNGETINVFNNGQMKRDFTYISDIVEGIYRLINLPPQHNKNWDYENPEASTSYAPYRVFNIGNNKPVLLMDFISTIEQHLGMKANMKFLPMQPGDVKETFADINDLVEAINFNPNTSINDGLKSFIDWYKSYYKLN